MVTPKEYKDQLKSGLISTDLMRDIFFPFQPPKAEAITPVRVGKGGTVNDDCLSGRFCRNVVSAIFAGKAKYANATIGNELRELASVVERIEEEREAEKKRKEKQREKRKEKQREKREEQERREYEEKARNKRDPLHEAGPLGQLGRMFRDADKAFRERGDLFPLADLEEVREWRWCGKTENNLSLVVFERLKKLFVFNSLDLETVRNLKTVFASIPFCHHPENLDRLYEEFYVPIKRLLSA